MYLDFDKRAFRKRAVEWELDESGERTGRWRRDQYYSDKHDDRRVPGRRTAMPWRSGGLAAY